MDPQKILIDQSEAEELHIEIVKAFEDARRSRCDLIFGLHERVIAYQRRAFEEVATFLSSENYEPNKSAEVILDPEKRERPKESAQRWSLQRDLVHFQISNYMANGQEIADAKKRLIHRYELRIRRLEELAKSDLLSFFLNAFASSLDPHSSYLSADDLEDFRIGMQLSLEGIGVALSERDGYSVVEQIIPGGAADRLDILRPEDKIIAVAEEGGEPVDIIDMALRDVVRLIRGRKGSTVSLTVLRQGDVTERFQVSIIRDRIDLEQQAAKLTFKSIDRAGKELNLAVIELPSFYGDRDTKSRLSSNDVRALLHRVDNTNADGLLLDLSRNGGGLLEEAVAISGYFLRSGGIVAIRDKKERRHILSDPSEDALYSGPIVVLVSRVSASASEILAGALRDYSRAVIVGDRHTFGKGSVQSVFPFRRGLGALRVTTALFFRPSGLSTQREGVNVHIRIPSPLDVETLSESNQPFALPFKRISPFIGRSSNYVSGDKRWNEVSSELIQNLAELSKKRVESSDIFQEIESNLANRTEDDGKVVLSDLMDDRDLKTSPSRKESETDGKLDLNRSSEKVEGDELTPQAEEALHVLADLVTYYQ